MSAKTLLRNSIAQILFLSGFTAPERRGRGRFSIATFHRVLPEAERQAYPFPGLVVTPEELDNFLTYFSEHFDCGNLATQHERYLRGESLTRPLLAITFDDAQYDNYKYARLVLERHKIKASFFVPVAAVEKQELLWHDRLGFAVLALLRQKQDGLEQLMRILEAAGISANVNGNLISNVVGASKGLTLETRLLLVRLLADASGNLAPPEFARLMNFDEIREMAADGHEIGSHSMTHCMMPECDDVALDYEVAASRRVLQAGIAQPIASFCYPNGNSDERTAQAVAQAGYLRAVTTDWGNNVQTADKFRLRRYDMVARYVHDTNGKFLPANLAFRMSGFYPGLAACRSFLHSNQSR